MAPPALPQVPRDPAFFFRKKLKAAVKTRLVWVAKHIRHGPAINTFAPMRLLGFTAGPGGLNRNVLGDPQNQERRTRCRVLQGKFAKQRCPLRPLAPDPSLTWGCCTWRVCVSSHPTGLSSGHLPSPGLCAQQHLKQTLARNPQPQMR